MIDGKYKGVPYVIDLDYRSFRICLIGEFTPMYGNNLLNCSKEEAIKIIRRKIRYCINKHLKELKGGNKE